MGLLAEPQVADEDPADADGHEERDEQSEEAEDTGDGGPEDDVGGQRADAVLVSVARLDAEVAEVR